jgi:hypothetical protein
MAELTEFEQAVIAAMERDINADDTDDTAADDDTDLSAETEPSEEEDDTSESQPDEEEADDASEDTEDDEETDEAPDESRSGGDADDSPQPAAAGLTVGDRTLTSEQAEQALAVYDWASQLTPQHMQAINALLSGQYRLEPVDAPAAQAAQPEPQVEDDLDELEPAVAQRIRDLEARLEAVTATQDNGEQERITAALQHGAQQFAAEYKLEPAEMERLEQAIVQYQSLTGHIRYTGDYAAGMRSALEQAYWADPELRSRALNAQIVEQAAKDAETRQQTSAKKRKAGSLSGSGGSVPRTAPVPSTPQDKRAAMVAEIASVTGSGQAG